MPVHTCVFVIVQSPVIPPPTWSQVPARAAGVSARSAAKSPPRATDQTMRGVRALACRSVALDIRRPPHVEASGYPLGNETGGHDSLPIRDRFLKRFSDDYPTRYVSVLMTENILLLPEHDFHSQSGIKTVPVTRNVVAETWLSRLRPHKMRARRPRIASVSRSSQGRETAVQRRVQRPGLTATSRGRRAHAHLLILTLSRVGNYHEQFIY